MEQICENDLQNTVSTDFRVQMTVFHVMPFSLFRCFLASRVNQGRQNIQHQTQRPWGRHQGPTKGTRRREDTERRVRRSQYRR